MLVCADGAPFLLGLPSAMARLGWVGGITVLVVAFACILHSATRLVRLHEHGGKRHNRYRELAQAVLGEHGRGVGGEQGDSVSTHSITSGKASLCLPAACRQAAGQRGGADLSDGGELRGAALPAAPAASACCALGCQHPDSLQAAVLTD